MEVGRSSTGRKVVRYKKFGLPGKEETDSPMKGGTMKIDSESGREHMTHLISRGLAAERTKARILRFTVLID